MAEQPRASARRSRDLGQHFLVDQAVIADVISHCDIGSMETILEFGPGRGALTTPISHRAGCVVAVEADAVMARRLQRRMPDHVEIVHGDFMQFPLPREPYRVIANPPFAGSGILLSRLLDKPSRGPRRADLILQYGMATKWSTMPPTTLRAAGWTPWWTFELGPVISRKAFRPIPRVDAAVLTITRREAPVLPERLATDLRDLLRKGWDPN